MLSVLTVDDHEIFRGGLRTLSAKSGWVLCGEAGTGRDALEMAAALRPDVILLDIVLPDMGGVEVILQLPRAAPQSRVVVLSQSNDHSSVHAAMAAGALGYVLKSDVAEDLTAAISAVGEGRVYVAPSVGLSGHLYPGSALSPLEVQIIELISQGHSGKSIARVLNLSLKTVEYHRTAALRKTDTSTSAALVRYALRHLIIGR